jgi:hypothetical protein
VAPQLSGSWQYNSLTKTRQAALANKHYKIDLLHLIVAPLLSDNWQHYYLTKTRQTGLANEHYEINL